MSPAERTMLIETFLGVMVLLLAMTLVAIARTPPVTATAMGSSAQDQTAGAGFGQISVAVDSRPPGRRHNGPPRPPSAGRSGGQSPR